VRPAITGYDRRVRRWRHLDTCQYVTILEADVPRVSCAEHGVVTAAVPRAGSDSGFTQLFEALVIDWLQEASLQALARQLGLSWGGRSTGSCSGPCAGDWRAERRSRPGGYVSTRTRFASDTTT